MLYIIPTPIGNKEDITLRAIKLLQEISYIISENTYTTRRLLDLYAINHKEKRLIKFTSHDNHKINNIVIDLKNQDGILMSEAGTPGLSDPGKTLLLICQENKIPTTVLPGATALIPAVISAGFPTTQRRFYGFLPHKKGRETLIRTMIQSGSACFFYESVHRIEKLIEQLETLSFIGTISIAREISKYHEQYITGSLRYIQELISTDQLPLKGEFVIGIYPYQTHEQAQMNYGDTLIETYYS